MCNSSLIATVLIPFEEKEVDEISDPLNVTDSNLFFSGQMVQNICVSFHSRIARLVIISYRFMNMVQSHSTMMDVVQHNRYHQTLISLLGSIRMLILRLTTTVNQLKVQGMIVHSEKGNFILKNS